MHAITFKNVSKVYEKYPNLKSSFLDKLGFGAFFNISSESFRALDDLTFSIEKGQRIGIIGRNGAGKTTLLKLITQNFIPTSGKIDINGNVQALMQTGIGFHNELSGIDNIRSALAFNNLRRSEWKKVINDILEFVELDEFIDQPLKTYSLGMKARLEFAVATSIHPDILIIDEVLGAGDGYFSHKSAQRMHELTHSGCTLLMISHSLSQLQQFCEYGLLLNKGQVVEYGLINDVIKTYEKVLQPTVEVKSAILNTKNHTPVEYALLSKEIIDEKGNHFATVNFKGLNSKGDPFQPGDHLNIEYNPSTSYEETHLSQADNVIYQIYLNDHIGICEIEKKLTTSSPIRVVLDPFLLGGGEYYVNMVLRKKDKVIFSQKLGKFNVYHANDACMPLFYHPVRMKIQGKDVEQVIDCHQ